MLHPSNTRQTQLFQIIWKKELRASQQLYSIISAFEGRNCQKTATNEEEKSALSPRQCTVLQVDGNDGKTTWIAFWIASLNSLSSRSGPQRQLAVCKQQKNAIWLQWRSDIRNWGVFWGPRQIVLQKKHRIVRETLESVYHPRRRLCWWINSNFA